MHNFKAAVKKQTGEDFPANPWDQLWGAICAVFGSWMNERAILYRKLNNIPAEWGTARNGTGHGIRQHGRQLGDGRSLLARRRNG